MALFGLKKNDKKSTALKVKEIAPKPAKVVKTKAVAVSAAVRPVADGNLTEVLIRPRVTEKATDLSSGNVYTFNIQSKANARDVARAVEVIYKVRPIKVNVVNFPRKRVFVRGRKGVSGGGKKAYVFLNKGEKIEFV